MRFQLGIFLCLIFFQSKAEPPIYFFPDLIRTEQIIWQQKNFDSPDGHVRFMGLFGLHPSAIAKYGFNHEDLDSLRGFSVAETLWLEYLCQFNDSTKADLALIYGPSILGTMPIDELVLTKARIKYSKGSDDLLGNLTELKECIGNISSSKVKTSNPVIRLSEIPRFTIYKVKKGDSLWKIRKSYPRLSLDDLILINKGTDAIYPGQRLNIPL
jgi:LysM repeat protein